MQQEITVKLQQKFCKEKEKPPYQSQAEAANNILFVFLMTRQRYK